MRFSPQPENLIGCLLSWACPESRRGSMEVERYFREGKIKEIAAYCETDVVGTYQVGCATNCFAAR